MADVWVDENGNEYTSGELEFEGPETGESANRLYTRRLLDLATDWNPVGFISKPIAAYAISKATGEPYEDVRIKMDEGSERAKEYVEQDSPKASSVLGVVAPLTGQIAGTVAGLGALGAGAKAALPTIARTAAKVPGATTAARAVADVGSKVAKAPVIRTALSTKPLSSSAAAAGLVGAGTAAVDVIKGESAYDTIIDTVGNMADTFAYMYGGRALPFKSVPAAMAAYEGLTNPIGRASRGESPVSLEDFTKDVTQGIAGGALARYARPAETSTAKGSKLAKQADRYKRVTNQTTGDIDVKAQKAYSGQKNLRDVPLEANVATQASLKTSIDKEIKQTAPHHQERATAIGKKIKSRIAEYEKGTSTEELQDMLKKAEEGIAKAEDRLKHGKPVTGATVNRVFANDPEAKESLLSRYADAAKADKGGLLRNIELDDATELKPDYILRARAEASKQSTEKWSPVSKAVRDKAYDLFDDADAKELIRESNALYSKASQLTGASEEALKSARMSSDQKRLLELSSQPGANRKLTSQIKRAINENRPISSIPTNEFDVTTLPDDVQKLLKEYDYHKAMQRIAEQDLVRKGTKFAITEAEQRAAAAPFLGSNFAMYTGVKEAAGKLGRHLPKASDKAVLDFISNVPADKAIEALKAKSGNVIKESMMNNIISELVKGGAK